MGKLYNSDLQEKLNAYIKEVGSQGEAAKKIGLSTGVLSTYRRSIYEGDIKQIERTLREFFNITETAATLHSTTDFVPTSISTQVYETIRLCHLKGGFAVECGDAGIGKTKAALKYKEDYPTRTIYVSVNPCLVSITAFLKLLYRSFNKTPTGRKDDMWFDIFEELRGGKKVLIVDEAQHLPIKTIEAIRAFFDGNPELGICFIGNAETVTGRGGRKRESFSQVSNRTKLTEIRHTTHITRKDIQLLFPELADCEKEIDLLHTVAQSEQGVRGTMNLYSNAVDNENTSFEGLVAMASNMKIIC